jgi:hypothetical protein
MRCPYIVKEVFDYGAVVIEDPRDDRILKVNGQRLRPYLGEVVPAEEIMSLELPTYGDASYILFEILHLLYILVFFCFVLDI